MSKKYRLSALLLCLTACATSNSSPEKKPRFAESINAQSFFKGGVFTYLGSPKTLSDFKDNGYQFATGLLSTNQAPKNGEFVFFESSKMSSKTSQGKSVSITSMCGTSNPTQSKLDASTADTLNSMVSAARSTQNISMINHPNLDWSISQEDLLSVDGFELLQISSGSAKTHDAGNESHPSTEEVWDNYMTKRHRIYAGAADSEQGPLHSWIQLWAPSLGKGSICDSLRQGHFYVSTGPKITALVVTPNTFDVAIDHWQPSTDHIDFIGAGGVLLESVTQSPARYQLRGGEGYVRAHVFQGEGTKRRDAWTQAYYIKYE